MMIDVARARRETPACENVVHFNNAGAALMPQPVVAAVERYFARETAIGGYEAAAEFAEELLSVYDSAAQLLNCGPDEIALVENATRAWDMAFYSQPLGAGDRVLTSEASYASNFIAFLQVSRRSGAVVEVVPSDEHGQVDVAALEAMVDERVKLIALTHVPTNGGLVNPAAAVGAVARAAGVPFLLDACQSVGQLPIDVATIGCDFLTATGRKFLRGPRGTGFLYVTERKLGEIDPIVIDGHAAPWSSRTGYELQPDGRRFEVWEQQLAGKVGLAVAARYAKEVGPAASWEHIRHLASGLRQRLAALPGVTVHDRGAVQGGIVTFTVDGVACRDVMTRLRREGINTSAPRVATARIDMEDRGLAGLVRASVHYFNTEEELDAVTAAVGSLER